MKAPFYEKNDCERALRAPDFQGSLKKRGSVLRWIGENMDILTTEETNTISGVSEPTVDTESAPDFNGEYDYTKEFPDEAYEAYIEAFEPNKRRRLFYLFVKRFFDVVISAVMLLVKR